MTFEDQWNEAMQDEISLLMEWRQLGQIEHMRWKLAELKKHFPEIEDAYVEAWKKRRAEVKSES